ncbi:MAG: hypothetical protein GX557_06420 [Chloroflexi bacterium]|nr:hypothetical protein [Chloroflexota bacterium]
MPSHFTLRMQFGLHQGPDAIARKVLALAKSAPVDEVMCFYFAEELNDGHEPLERVQQWIEASRPYRKELQSAGVALSLNPWHTVLHCDRHRTLKPGQNWQTMVDPTGRQATAVVCPLDPDWRAYYAETLRMYAREGFRVIWVDDDIRYHNHEPLAWGGCFCPLHVAEFNRRARERDALAVPVTRAEIVAACLQPGAPHPWRSLWFDMWEETHLELLSEWRRIVEAEGCRLGLMSSDMEAHAAEGRRWADWWRAFGGGQPPVHRPHFWGYGDMPGPALIHSIALLDQNRSIQPAALESGPEIECFPYGRWNKSYRQTGAQLALAHILGSANLNISLYDFMGNDPDDDPSRTAFLTAWRPACNWLADAFPMTLRSVGVGVPWSEDMGRTIRLEPGASWRSLQCPSRGWAHWLGASGHAFAMHAAPRVNALAGPVAWAFDERHLRDWLSRGVLLDGGAAEVLLQRGLGEFVGLTGGRRIGQEDLLYSVENTLDARFGLRAGAQISVNAKPYAQRLFQGELAPGARMVSDLRSPTQAVVGHGLLLFENSLGGRVAIVPWDANGAVEMNAQRAAQLASTLAWLDPTLSYGWVEGGPWLVPQFLRRGRGWRGVVWNASPDELDEFRVHLPAGMPEPARAVQLTARGERLTARLSGDCVTCAHPLGQWECVVLAPESDR